MKFLVNFGKEYGMGLLLNVMFSLVVYGYGVMVKLDVWLNVFGVMVLWTLPVLIFFDDLKMYLRKDKKYFSNC